MLKALTVHNNVCVWDVFQHYRHTAPMLPFLKGNRHTKGDTRKFSVEMLQQKKNTHRAQQCLRLGTHRGRRARLLHWVESVGVRGMVQTTCQ